MSCFVGVMYFTHNGMTPFYKHIQPLGDVLKHILHFWRTSNANNQMFIGYWDDIKYDGSLCCYGSLSTMELLPVSHKKYDTIYAQCSMNSLCSLVWKK